MQLQSVSRRPGTWGLRKRSSALDHPAIFQRWKILFLVSLFLGALLPAVSAQTQNSPPRQSQDSVSGKYDIEEIRVYVAGYFPRSFLRRNSIIGGSCRSWDMNYSFIYTWERYEAVANIPENYSKPWYTINRSVVYS